MCTFLSDQVNFLVGDLVDIVAMADFKFPPPDSSSGRVDHDPEFELSQRWEIAADFGDFVAIRLKACYRRKYEHRPVRLGLSKRQKVAKLHFL